MEDAYVNTITVLMRRSEDEVDPEEIEGGIPRRWKLKRGVRMGVSNAEYWDFSRRSQRHTVRE